MSGGGGGGQGMNKKKEVEGCSEAISEQERQGMNRDIEM